MNMAEIPSAKRLTLRDTDCKTILLNDWVAFDTETWLIAPGQAAPRMVCGSFCDNTGQAEVLEREDALDIIEHLLATGTPIVGQNIPFDMAVVVANRPRLLVPVFRAFEKGLILSIDIIEKLRKIARGWNKFDHRFKSKPRYSLEEMVYQYLDEKMTGKKGDDVWRMRYKELDGVPIHEWPADAYNYAKDDAILTARVFQMQQAVIPSDVQFKQTMVDLRRQMMAVWGLYLMRVHGFRTDGLAVDMLEHELHGRVDGEIEYLISAGIYRYEGPKKDPMRKKVRCMDIIQQRVRAAFEGRGEDCPMTEGGKGEVKKPKPKTDAETLEKSMDVDLGRLADIMGDKKLLDTYVPVLKQGVLWPINPYYNVLVDSGRTSCSKPNVQNQPRKGGVRESFVPRPGHVYVGCDYHTAELRSLAQYCLEVLGVSEMAKALEHTEKYPHGKDLHLVMAAHLLHTDYDDVAERLKKGDKAVKDARQIAKCFHPDTEVLTPDGWVRIPDLDGTEKIATPTLLSDGQVSLTWEVPERLTYREHSGELVHLKSEGIDLVVTPDHRMVGYKQGKGSNRLGQVAEFTPYTLNSARWWVNAGIAPDGPGVPVDKEVLRLLVAIQADGSYVSKGGGIRLGFSKQRKIERLKVLLAAAQCPHHWQKVNTQGASHCYIGAEEGTALRALLDKKQFPTTWVKDLTAEQREVVLSEVRYWDGCQMSNWTAFQYYSTQLQNIEVLQAIATLSGYKTRVRTTLRDKEEHSTTYTLTIKDHNHSRGGNLTPKEIPYIGKVYCLTTSTDCVLVRGGASRTPVITKQCLNFGYPGGLGAAKFLEFAWASYRMKLADTEYAAIKEAKNLKKLWMEAFPEMRLFFDHISSLSGGADSCTMHLIKSGRVRGDVGYTEACNTVFQSLTADGAKLAVWATVKESWTGYKWDEPIPDDATDISTDSPLLGYRPNGFVHDEIIGESPLPLYRQHAARLADVMKEAMCWFVDRVPVEAEAHVMRRWWKDAEPTYNDKGELIPWSPKNPYKVLAKLQADHPALQEQWGGEQVDALHTAYPDVDWKGLHRAWMLDELAKERTGEVNVSH